MARQGLCPKPANSCPHGVLLSCSTTFHAAQGAIAPAEHEEVLPVELLEAWFTVLKAVHRGKPRPGHYYVRCADRIPAQL